MKILSKLKTINIMEIIIICLVAIALLILLSGAIIALIDPLEDDKKYEYANSLVVEGKYEQAIEVYTELEDYAAVKSLQYLIEIQDNTKLMDKILDKTEELIELLKNRSNINEKE